MADLDTQMRGLQVTPRDDEERERKSPYISEVSDAPISQADYDNLANLRDQMDEAMQSPERIEAPTYESMPPQPGSVEEMIAEGAKQPPRTSGVSTPAPVSSGATLPELSRGTPPSFSVMETFRSIPGGQGEEALDFTLNTPENNQKVYDRYWAPYDGADETPIIEGLDKAIGFRTGIVDDTVNPQTGRQIYDVFGGLRSGLFPPDATYQEKARIAAMAGAIDLVYPGEKDEQGNAIDLQFVPVPAVQELRYYQQAYADRKGIAGTVVEVLGASDIQIPFTDQTMGSLARALPDAIVLSGEQEVGKFITFMDRTGYVNPYIMRDLAFAQGSGTIDFARKQGRATDTIVSLTNLAVGMYDFFTDDENSDVMVEGEDGKRRVQWDKFPMAANRMAKRYNIPVEQAESALLFAPDLVTRVTDVAPEIAVDMGIAGAVRVALAGKGYANFHKWLRKDEKYGGAKSLEDAVAYSKTGPSDIISRYLETTINTYPSKTLNKWARASRVEDLDIWTGVKMAGSGQYRKEAMKGPIEAAKKEHEQAVEALEKLRDADPAKIRIAQQRLQRAENRLYRLDAESKVPPYVVDLAKESGLALSGAALLGQIVQDSGVTDPTALVWTEVGGALTAAVAPSIVTGVYKAPVTLSFAALNGVKQLLGIGTGDVVPVSKIPQEARQWFSVLQKLDPEDYENAVAVIERGDQIIQDLLAIKDPATGLPLLNPADVGFTTAELINIPLLRIHQQALGESVKLGDIAGFKGAFNEISKLIVQERDSVDKLGQALDRLAIYEDPSYASRFPELSGYVTDMRKIHGGLKADLDLRQAQIAEIAQRQAETAELYLMGKKIEAVPGGGYRVPNYQEAFEQADDLRTADMIAQGADPDDILNAQSAVVNDRLQKLLDVGEEMRALNAQKDGDPSLLMSATFHTLNKRRENRIDKAYRGWEQNAPEDTYMDARFIFEDINERGGAGLGDPRLQEIGTKDSPLAGTTKGARKLYGANLSSQELAGLNDVFGNGAKLELNFWEQSLGKDTLDSLFEGAEVDPGAGPFTKWLGLANFLGSATEESLEKVGLNGKISVDEAREVAKKLSLPVSPRDMRLVSSALGDRAFQAARSRRPQRAIEPARTRENFLAIAEDEELGFRADYFNIRANEDGTFSRGTPVGKDLVDNLREINTEFRHDIVDRIRRDDLLSGWTLTKEGVPVGDSLMELDFRDGTGPSSWFDNLFSPVTKDMTASQMDVVVDQKFAKAFDGRRVGDKYYLDADNIEANQALVNTLIPYLRQRMARTPGAVNFISSIDKGATPDDTVKYLQKMFAEDPSALAEGLVFLDDPIFEAVENLRVHKFDAEGNIISSEPLLDLDDIFETISFKNLRTVNKQVAEIADEADAAIIDMKATIKSQAQKKFTAENSYAITATNFSGRFGVGAEGDKQLYTLAIADDGLPVLDELRQAHVRSVVEEARLAGRTDIDQVTEWAEQGFDTYVRRSVSRHINAEAVGAGTSGEIVEVGEGARTALTVDSRKLRDLVGDEGGTESQRIRAENLKLVLGDEHYGNIKTITDYMARKNEVYESVNITGEARALSIESWLSRIYSISRGVVSPRYVLSEALIQGSRLASQSAFQKAIADPEVARHIADIVRTGKIPDANATRRFNEAMITAIARGLRENEEEQIETEYPIPEPLDMQQLRGVAQ